MACEPSAFDGFALSPGLIRLLGVFGIHIVECRWRYGDVALRRTPFPPHVDNAGEVTSVDGRVGEGFNGDGWYPGDHAGCLCRLVPIFGRGPVRTVTP